MFTCLFQFKLPSTVPGGPQLIGVAVAPRFKPHACASNAAAALYVSSYRHAILLSACAADVRSVRSAEASTTGQRANVAPLGLLIGKLVRLLEGVLRDAAVGEGVVVVVALGGLVRERAPTPPFPRVHAARLDGFRSARPVPVLSPTVARISSRNVIFAFVKRSHNFLDALHADVLAGSSFPSRMLSSGEHKFVPKRIVAPPLPRR